MLSVIYAEVYIFIVMLSINVLTVNMPSVVARKKIIFMTLPPGHRRLRVLHGEQLRAVLHQLLQRKVTTILQSGEHLLKNKHFSLSVKIKIS